MARDYGGKRRVVRQKSNLPQQLFWMLASFLGGYLAATVFDFTSLSSWVNTHILAKTKDTPKSTVVAKQPEPPKPKFEFYTLLAKDKKTNPVAPTATPSVTATVKQPIQSPVVTAKVSQESPISPIAENKSALPNTMNVRGNYLIQVASFKNRAEADRMKAALTLKGFDVRVVATLQQQVNWFRVIVGPFNSRTEAEKTQLTLVRNERIRGMIRKMDA